MNQTLRKILILLLTLVFLGSAAKIIYQTMESARAMNLRRGRDSAGVCPSCGLPDMPVLPLSETAVTLSLFFF